MFQLLTVAAVIAVIWAFMPTSILCADFSGIPEPTGCCAVVVRPKTGSRLVVTAESIDDLDRQLDLLVRNGWQVKSMHGCAEP